MASQATWQAADCYRNMGDNDRARRHYTALLSTPGYAERARAAIGALDSGSGPAVASRHVAAEAAKPAAAPAKARATTTRPAKPPTKTKASRPPVKVDEPGASDQMP